MNLVWISELPIAFILIASLLIGLGLGFFVFYQNSFSEQTKINANKALLKQLLEGFGLEVPPELSNPDSAVIKSDENR